MCLAGRNGIYLLGFELALEVGGFAVVVVGGAGPFGLMLLAPIGHGALQMRMRLSGSHIQCHQLQEGEKSK